LAFTARTSCTLQPVEIADCGRARCRDPGRPIGILHRASQTPDGGTCVRMVARGAVIRGLMRASRPEAACAQANRLARAAIAAGPRRVPTCSGPHFEALEGRFMKSRGHAEPMKSEADWRAVAGRGGSRPTIVANSFRRYGAEKRIAPGVPDQGAPASFSGIPWIRSPSLLGRDRINPKGTAYPSAAHQAWMAPKLAPGGRRPRFWRRVAATELRSTARSQRCRARRASFVDQDSTGGARNHVACAAEISRDSSRDGPLPVSKHQHLVFLFAGPAIMFDATLPEHEGLGPPPHRHCRGRRIFREPGVMFGTHVGRGAGRPLGAPPMR